MLITSQLTTPTAKNFWTGIISGFDYLQYSSAYYISPIRLSLPISPPLRQPYHIPGTYSFHIDRRRALRTHTDLTQGSIPRHLPEHSCYKTLTPQIRVPPAYIFTAVARTKLPPYLPHLPFLHIFQWMHQLLSSSQPSHRRSHILYHLPLLRRVQTFRFWHVLRSDHRMWRQKIPRSSSPACNSIIVLRGSMSKLVLGVRNGHHRPF